MVPACDRPRPLYAPPSFYHLSAVYASPLYILTALPSKSIFARAIWDNSFKSRERVSHVRQPYRVLEIRPRLP